MNALRQWIKGGHAIFQAAFAVEFTRAPTPDTIRELLALHPKVREEYPRKAEGRGRAVNIAGLGDGSPALDFGELVLSGFVFDSLKADGQTERAINLDGNTLSVVRADYESWGATWKQVREIFKLMLPVLLETRNIGAFTLQFHDRFVWEGERKSFQADMLFRPGSPFLAANIFEVPDIWHSFHGYFEFPNAHAPHRLLNVAEVQLLPSADAGLEPNMGLVADVKLTHRVHHGFDGPTGTGQPIEKEEEVLGVNDDLGLLDAYMEEMHDKNKWLLARLINDDMCDEIELQKPE